MHLCTHSKQGHMRPGRYCYTRIEIKLANAISFLPRAAGPICKHQTASLQKTCWFSLFKASPRLPNPNSISTPVFIQNAFSLTVANYILIHEAHFIEEIVWLAWDWHWVTTVQKAGKQKWGMMKAVVCCSFFAPLFSVMLMEISRDTGISMMAQSCWNSLQTWFHPTFSLFNLSSLTGWKIEISPRWIEPHIPPIQKKTFCMCISCKRITTASLKEKSAVLASNILHSNTVYYCNIVTLPSNM